MTNLVRYDFANTPESNAVRVSFTVTPGAITVGDGTGEIYYEFQFYGIDENGGAISTKMNSMRIFGGTSQIKAKSLTVKVMSMVCVKAQVAVWTTYTTLISVL